MRAPSLDVAIAWTDKHWLLVGRTIFEHVQPSNRPKWLAAILVPLRDISAVAGELVAMAHTVERWSQAGEYFRQLRSSLLVPGKTAYEIALLELVETSAKVLHNCSPARPRFDDHAGYRIAKQVARLLRQPELSVGTRTAMLDALFSFDDNEATRSGG
jgi:hypothetical protein